MKRKVSFIFQAIWNDNKKLLLVSAVQIPLLVILPYLQLFLTKTLVSGIEESYLLQRYILVIISIFLLQLILMVVKEWVGATSEWNNKFLVNSFLKPLDRKTMCTDYENVEGMAGQKTRQKALNAVYTSGQSVISKAGSFAVNLLGLLFYGITVGLCNAVILCIVIITTYAGYLLTKLLYKYEQKHKDDILKYSKKMQYIENESVSVQAAREIRLYDMSELLENLYQDSKNKRIKIEDKICEAKFLVNSGGSILSFIRNFAAYFYLIHSVVSGQITAADFILLTGLVSGLSAWLSGVMNDVGELRKMSIYMEDYFAYLDLPESTDGIKKAQAVCENPMEKNPKLEFRQVSFRYEGAKEDTLKDINLVIIPGEKLAVVGKNGAGKTTLIKLLSGLYRPCSGMVLVDGVNITDYTKEEYFRTISAVFQDIMLLPVSILQNISSKTGEKTDECKVRNCLEKAGISEKIAQLPHGLNTPLQKAARNDAVELSGGEQQKVMIAKAIYKEAEVLILDEPTAALDPISENNIYQKYDELTQGMTSFFISHRLASTNFCDDIILIDDGRIIEQGNHQELMHLKGKYWKMFEMQSHYYAEEENCGY